MRTKLHNLITSTIIQGSGPSASAKDAAAAGGGSAQHFSMWSAGLAGQGQIVGMGDSGVDMDSCYFWDPQVSQGLNLRTLRF